MIHNLINLGAGGGGNGVFHGADFRFPIEAEYKLALAHGFTGFRIAHKWYRLQMEAGKTGPTNNVEAYRSSIALARLLAPGAMIVIEDHSYGVAIPAVHTTGTFTDWNNRAKFDHPNLHTVETARALARFYGEKFPELKNVPTIAFECGNEMNKLSVPLVFEVQDAFFDEMRTQGFVTNPLIGSTSGWGGITQVKDEMAQLKNLRCNIISTHRYFDPGREGNEPAIDGFTEADIGSTGLAAKVRTFLSPERTNLEAARANGLKIFLGEYGLPNTPLGVALVPHFLNFFKEFEDVLWGVAPWIGAEWSANDSFAKMFKDRATGIMTPTAGMGALAKHWPEIMGTPPVPVTQPPVVVTPPPVVTSPTPEPTDPVTGTPSEDVRKLMLSQTETFLAASQSTMSRAKLTALITAGRDALR